MFQSLGADIRSVPNRIITVLPKNMPVTQESNSINISEIIGTNSVILILLAIIIGVASLIIRNHKFSLFAASSIIAFAFAGLGMTFWGLSSSNRMQQFTPYGVDPSSWLAEFSYATARAGLVLPACSIGMILVGLSFLLTKTKPIKVENPKSQ